MMQLLPYFASAEAAAEEPGLFTALGLDARMLILQVIAFGILLWVLGKFVYPHLIAAIDKRDKAIAESVAAASEAEAQAEKTQAEIESMFKAARQESAALVETAQKEAAMLVKEAEDKAKKRADQIVSDARAQLDQDVVKARKALRTETTELVALATERILHEKIDQKRDAKLIEDALKEAR